MSLWDLDDLLLITIADCSHRYLTHLSSRLLFSTALHVKPYLFGRPRQIVTVTIMCTNLMQVIKTKQPGSTECFAMAFLCLIISQTTLNR